MEDLVNQLSVTREIERLELDAKPFNWSYEADRLILNNPEKYLSIVEMFGQGDSLEKIHRATAVSKNALRSIRNRHPGALEAYKHALTQNIEEGAHLVTERVIERIDEVSPNKLGFLLDMLVKQGQLLSGSPTSRHEQVHVSSPEDLQRIFEQLPEA